VLALNEAVAISVSVFVQVEAAFAVAQISDDFYVSGGAVLKFRGSIPRGIYVDLHFHDDSAPVPQHLGQGCMVGLRKN
jgi:hypothetical protein